MGEKFKSLNYFLWIACQFRQDETLGRLNVLLGSNDEFGCLLVLNDRFAPTSLLRNLLDALFGALFLFLSALFSLLLGAFLR